MKEEYRVGPVELCSFDNVIHFGDKNKSTIDESSFEIIAKSPIESYTSTKIFSSETPSLKSLNCKTIRWGHYSFTLVEFGFVLYSVRSEKRSLKLIFRFTRMRARVLFTVCAAQRFRVF